MDDAKVLLDGDYIKIFNKTIGMELRSQPKLPNFYGSTLKSVTYYDEAHRYEKVLNVPVIEHNNGELKLLLSPGKVHISNTSSPVLYYRLFGCSSSVTPWHS
jgi:hypothetical protein